MTESDTGGLMARVFCSPSGDQMRRRRVLAMLAFGAAFFAGVTVLAQVRQPLIDVLMHGKESALPGRVEALVEGLRDLGYVEDRNYRMDVRWSDNEVERLPALARELLLSVEDRAECVQQATEGDRQWHTAGYLQRYAATRTHNCVPFNLNPPDKSSSNHRSLQCTPTQPNTTSHWPRWSRKSVTFWRGRLTRIYVRQKTRYGTPILCGFWKETLLSVTAS